MKIKTLLLSTALMGVVAMANEATLKQEGVGYIKMLGGELKSQLQVKMKEDPTGVAAAEFCASSAEALTKDINTKLPENASVRRTALKTRSATNKPDAIDISVMEAYGEAIASKRFDPQSPIKVVEDGNTTRVYKPLLTEAACLKCHGAAVSPQISALIQKQYPHDQAVGFKEGDLRGVIVAEIKKK